MQCPVCEAPACRPFLTVDDRPYRRCDACLATWLDPVRWPAPDQERAQYRLHRNDPADPNYRLFLSRLATPLLARLAPGRHGLDYGSGPGPALAAMLQDAGHSVRLYDPCFAPDRAALADRYDFITCTEVIEHFHRPAAEFRALDALLRPGGWLALMTTFQTDDDAFAGWHYRRDPTHVVFYREATLRHLAGLWGWRCDVPVANVALLQKGGG
ncbi:MAG: methyltransferase domain-containing protein [Gammaproteobacteria bacterium]|nr:methyltransferase domain-containing protein [Gammaproteobacteria bacterium]